MTFEQETALINAVATVFGDRNFDTLEIIHKAYGRRPTLPRRTELSDAIDAAFPHSRLIITGHHRRRLRVLQHEFKLLAKKYFRTDGVGWWHVAKLPNGPVERVARDAYDAWAAPISSLTY
jgi:hypothetical protein